jgi:hypothetical protein
MGQEWKREAIDDDANTDLRIEEPPASQRHRHASEIRFAKVSNLVEQTPTPAVAFEPLHLGLPRIATGRLTDELRLDLWELVHAALFAPGEQDASRSFRAGTSERTEGGWTLPPTRAITERPAVRRVWTSPPLGGTLDLIPEDIVEVLESWIALVEPADVYLFIESVHDSLDAMVRARFAATVNAALERGHSDHRFVLGRLLPIASRADIAAIERGVLASRAASWTAVAHHLEDALAGLAQKPEAELRGAVQSAIRAVEDAAFALTRERYFDLEDALDDLECRGHIGTTLKTAYAGLFAYVTNTVRRTTTDDARLILVMCAGFVGHLASRLR